MGNHLTTRQDNISLVVTKSDLMYVRNVYPEFRFCPEGERSNRLFLEIQYAAVMDGQDMTDKTLAIMAKEVGNAMMQGAACGLTYPEIRTAIRNGAAGQYGEWFRLNVRTILSWMDAFIEDNKATYREIQRKLEQDRQASMGEFYLEKVRHHAELMAKRNKI